MLKSVQAKDYMSEKFLKLRPQTDLFDAIDMLIEYKLPAAPVVDDANHLLGLLTEGDCLKAILTFTYHEEEKGGSVADFMRHQTPSVNIETDIIAISKMMIEQDLYCIPIVQRDSVVGQINRRDVLRAVESFAKPL